MKGIESIMGEYRFKVNLGGMIEILSDHLYSSPNVYIRELLQNGVDAIVARELRDADYKERKEGTIKLTVDEGKSLIFEDNGLGLTQDEIHKFLAIIGQSSKRDLENGKILSDFIGRFGIGLLSYFMVSNRIRLQTKSVDSETGYEWIGNPDGTYTLTESDKSESGTTIFLEAKEGCEEYFTAEKIEKLILHYGMILPYPILMDDGTVRKRINPVLPPWTNADASKEEIMSFGEIIFGQPFLDCIPISSKSGGVDGVAYILPYEVQPSTKQNHLIYLKNMLLTEKGQNILPDWAVFVKCIVNAKDLRPTASREGFYEDEDLEKAREDIGECIASYLKNLATKNKAAYRRFLEIHSLVVKSMAVEDDEIYRLFIDDLEFYTTRGLLTGLELRLSNETLLYAGLDEYKQLSQIFVSQGKLLVNAGYVYTGQLLRKMEDFFSVTVAQVQADEIEEMLKDASLEDVEKAIDFVELAKRVLSDYDCAVEVKQFIPANLPAFYYRDANAKLYQEIQHAQEYADSIFLDMLSNFAGEIKEQANSILYFNMRNPIIRKMVEIENVSELEDMILILYIQTLLIGGFPLRNNEMGIMNEKLLNLLEKSLN